MGDSTTLTSSQNVPALPSLVEVLEEDREDGSKDGFIGPQQLPIETASPATLNLIKEGTDDGTDTVQQQGRAQGLITPAEEETCNWNCSLAKKKFAVALRKKINNNTCDDFSHNQWRSNQEESCMVQGLQLLSHRTTTLNQLQSGCHIFLTQGMCLTALDAAKRT
eukprot:3836911-Ditylum_brightwellii.AAC.1